MDVQAEEIFGADDAPLNRTNFAIGVYQNVVYIYGGECSFTGNCILRYNQPLFIFQIDF